MTEPRAAACGSRQVALFTIHPSPPSRFSIRSAMFKKLVSRLRDTAQPSSFFSVHRGAQGYANGAGNSRDGVRAGSRGGGEEEAWAPGRSRGHGVVEETEGGAATSKAPRATWSMCHKRGRSGSATVSAPLAPRRSSLNVIVFAAIVTDPDKGRPGGGEGRGKEGRCIHIVLECIPMKRFVNSQDFRPDLRASPLPEIVHVQLRDACRWTVSFFCNLDNPDVAGWPTGKRVPWSGTIREHLRNGTATFEMQQGQPAVVSRPVPKNGCYLGPSINRARAIASYDSSALRARFEDSIVIRLRGWPGCAYLFVRFSRSLNSERGITRESRTVIKPRISH